MNKVFIIAEAGVNHNGDEKLAFQLVDAAIDAGADAVKFQTFKTENVVTKKASKAVYQKQTTGNDETQFEMIKKLELSHESHEKLRDYCRHNGILFISTAFDSESLHFLNQSMRLELLKIPSGEITNGPLLLEYAYTGCDLILSTGMSTLGEIEDALGVIAFGLLKGLEIKPCKEAFRDAYSSKEGLELLKNKVTLLHCTTDYPALVEDINLLAMRTMEQSFGLRVGYSDHSDGVVISIAAAAMGAKVIEKHFTLNKKLPGPDHQASLEPDELKFMVDGIRQVELAMGHGFKIPTEIEKINAMVARKSLVAKCNINKGEFLTEANLTSKRPASGKSPMDYWEALGNRMQKSFYEDENIT